MWTVTSFFGLCKAFSVPHPNLEISGWEGVGGGGEGRSSKPWDNAGNRYPKKKFFPPFGPQFGLKIRGSETPLLDPPHWFTVTRMCERWRKFIVYEPITNESSSRAGCQNASRSVSWLLARRLYIKSSCNANSLRFFFGKLDQSNDTTTR